MTRNQAAKAARDCADSVIEQLTRLSKGWDQGEYRDDDVWCAVSVKDGMAQAVEEAFNLSRQFT